MDRTKLLDLQYTVAEYIETTCEKFDLLRQHHYIAKSQSAFLKQKKNKSMATKLLFFLILLKAIAFWFKTLSKNIIGKTAMLPSAHFLFTSSMMLVRSSVKYLHHS